MATQPTADLPKLAGMAHHPGKTPAHWISLTGTNPSSFPGFIAIRNGLCYWTQTAEAAYKNFIANRKADGAALGVAH